MSVMQSPGAAGAPTPQEIPTSHPRGLAPIFMTEMWERFSYYGMRALLVGYLVDYHGWLPTDASTVYKWYTSLVYLTPLLGGLLADRYFGLRSTIVAGASLMALGHFLMAFENMTIFYAALGCLIAGNGFFKPNMSTLVGRMYFKNDPRRDRAFTIFYMGINLGAFLSPIVCGSLRQAYGYHWGFAAAGVGMALGLWWFLVKQRQIDADVAAAGNSMGAVQSGPHERGGAASDPDEEKPGAAGVAGAITRAFPVLFSAVGLLLPVRYLWLFFRGEASGMDLLMPCAYGAIFVWMSVTLWSIRGAARDKSTCIFIFFFFSVLFWMAFEQAGNSLNLWAQYSTRLSFLGWTYPHEHWQSVNALLIVALAPAISALWMKLGPREPSTAVKMLLAMACMTAAFAVMVLAARAEDQTVTAVPCQSIPPAFSVNSGGEIRIVPRPDDAEEARRAEHPVDAGRLRFDAGKKELVKQGVLGEYEILNLLYRTCPPSWDDEVLGAQQADKSRQGGLETLTAKASKSNPVTRTFSTLPDGFRLVLSEEQLADAGVTWNPATRTMTFTAKADKPTINRLRASGGDPVLRDALYSLKGKSVVARVSGWWLFLQYLLATLGELCLSPVGLSMVTKLAPLRFASLFMGVWLLSSSVAQYAGGTIGESWGISRTPTGFFQFFVFTSMAGVAALLVLIAPLKRMMHDVR